jgi:hypothetical protein
LPSSMRMMAISFSMAKVAVMMGVPCVLGVEAVNPTFT